MLLMVRNGQHVHHKLPSYFYFYNIYLKGMAQLTIVYAKITDAVGFTCALRSSMMDLPEKGFI